MAGSHEKYIRVPTLEILPSAQDSMKVFNHWEKMLNNFITAVETSTTQAPSNSGENPPALVLDKLAILTGYVSPDVYALFEHLDTFIAAIDLLKSLYRKKKNIIYARHLLAIAKQDPGKSITEFSQELLMLARDCSFEAVTADEYRREAVRDSLITGLQSSTIRLRLLEHDDLTLEKAIKIAESMEQAQKFSSSYQSPSQPVLNVNSNQSSLAAFKKDAPAANKLTKKCIFCGEIHERTRKACPAKDATCFHCGVHGHYAKVCRLRIRGEPAASLSSLVSDSILAGIPHSLRYSRLDIAVANHNVKALIDSGAYECYISESLSKILGLHLFGREYSVTLADKKSVTTVLGCVEASLKIPGWDYGKVKFSVVKDLIADVILGLEFMKKHGKVVFEFGGSSKDLVISNGLHCAVAAAKVSAPPQIFKFVDPKLRPVAVRSRNYSSEDRKFIASELSKLLRDGVVERSVSPWRAQVLVTKDCRHKKRLVIDYSQTINRFTPLDAYPLPKIENIVNEVAKGMIYSTIDLKSAYHQVPLSVSDRPYTAFEAGGSLYQFCRLPFGVTNGVAAFQRFIDNFIAEHKLQGTVAYLDNVTIYGENRKEHDGRLQAFMSAAADCGLTLNHDKCLFSVSKLSLLGHLISHNRIQPDPDHLKPLLEMPVPSDNRSLKRFMGMLAYYSKWIPSFSSKIKPLCETCDFPLIGFQLEAINNLKSDLLRACLSCIYDDEPFQVECDASDRAIGAILSQRGRPVAFMSRTLSKSEIKYPAVEKEALAIIESVRKWGYLLIRNEFRLITDQKALSFIFRKSHPSKIKNSKLSIWKLELSSLKYEIVHRPGVDHVGADALSRLCSITSSSGMSLQQVHEALSHPGVRRLHHFVRAKNLPFSMEDVKKICSDCPVCSECKPRFFKSNQVNHLVKATRPWERISIDFKGPVSGPRRFILVIIDEYSRFPFAYACRDMTSATVINCLSSLFSLVGLPEYVHSDRGTSFLSKDVTVFLTRKGVATSKSTPYHPTGNSQCERLNQTLWKAIKLRLATQRLPERLWEQVLPDALHSIRSLLCTSTNCCPHDRFFRFERRSMLGVSIPDWLLCGGTVLLRNFVRNKSDPEVVRVELLDANPKYALIRHRNGTESTVSVRDLAPCPREENENGVDFRSNEPVLDARPEEINQQNGLSPNSSDQNTNSPSADVQSDSHDTSIAGNEPHTTVEEPPIRRSSRIRRAPDWYGDRTT